MRRLLLGIALAVALPVTGCGGGGGNGDGKNAKLFTGEKKQVAQVIDDLVAASHAGKPDMICTQIFTPGLAQAIAKRNKKTCRDVVQAQLVNPNEDISVTALKLNGSSALVTVREQNKNASSLSLTKQSGEWRINAIQ